MLLFPKSKCSRVHWLVFGCAALITILGCRRRAPNASLEGVLDSTSTNQIAVQGYENAMAAFLSQGSVRDGWNWFMYRPHGFSGLSAVLISLLPELDAEIWGSPKEKFAKFGHFVLPGDEDRFLPSSMGIGKFPSSTDPNPRLVTTETCGTCHMGRIRIGDVGPAQKERILFLFGGVNTKFDVRLWRTALEKTVSRYLSSSVELSKTAKTLQILVNSKPTGFFDKNLEEDRAQRDLFLKDGRAEFFLSELVELSKGFSLGKARQRRTSYHNLSGGAPNVDEGHSGQVDASGDLLSQRLLTDMGMPPGPSLTDIPSVWRQSEYSAGQWDGGLGDQFIRNLAAQIAVVPGNTVDRRVSFRALQFVKELPPPVFPFLSHVQGDLKSIVEKGHVIFQKNCETCHRPNSDQRYPQVGTDGNRATVMTAMGAQLVVKNFIDACAAILPDKSDVPSCGNFTQHLRGADPILGPGYHAKPLTGIWARAPYLHNGSVPTLRHLLVPGTRPTKFVLGSLDYDEQNVGFEWEVNNIEALRAKDPEVNLMDTAQEGLSSKGHDQLNLVIGEASYRLDWTPHEQGDDEALEALLEYLKTL
jgi:hypothetical protein